MRTDRPKMPIPERLRGTAILSFLVMAPVALIIGLGHLFGMTSNLTGVLWWGLLAPVFFWFWTGDKRLCPPTASREVQGESLPASRPPHRET